MILFIIMSILLLILSLVLMIYCFYRPFPSNQGPIGIQGPLNGTTGNTGPKGITGLPGPFGPQGEQGPIGYSCIYYNIGLLKSYNDGYSISNISNKLYIIFATQANAIVYILKDENFYPGGTFFIYAYAGFFLNYGYYQIPGNSNKNVKRQLNAGFYQCVLMGDNISIHVFLING